MTLKSLETNSPGSPPAAQFPDAEKAVILEQLDLITSNGLFNKSKRYPNFLRFIVEHSLEGRTDLLKERTLGVEVFHRPNDYDTNADPVVRITAGEIRKRLAQYCQVPGRDHELRMDLPLGSYAPIFSWPQPAPQSRLSSDNHGTRAGLSDRDEAVDTVGPAMAPHPLRETTPHDQALLVDRYDDPEPSARYGWHRFAGKRAATIIFGVLIASVALLAIGNVASTIWQAWVERGLMAFWVPVLHAEGPALIVVGVHSFGSNGRDLSPGVALPGSQSMLASMTNTNMVPISDVASYSQCTDLLVRHHHPYLTQSATETTFAQLQPGPVVLIGALDNTWTLRFTDPLRFHFAGQSDADGVIEDRQRPEVLWRFNNAQSAHANSQDYAVVASFYEPKIEQRVLIAAGIGKSGTAAAAQFLTNNRALQSWLVQNHVPKGANIELVLTTEIVDGQQGPPRVVASSIW